MNTHDLLINDILPRVEKPSRYLGTELNAVHKDPDRVDLRVCLFFPDLYELGLGNLGLHILYAILNDLDWVWAERGYSPAPDLEAILRDRQIPLFMYESKAPLREADVLGFTLQSELTYTNVLNALDLAGIPVRAEARTNGDPLVFAGGPATYNPEPMVPFIDCFVIGDGEEAVVDMAMTLRGLRHAPRQEKLEALAQLGGFYVPGLHGGGERARNMGPMGPTGPISGKDRADAPRIVKRLVHNLDEARFPSRYIVPYTQLVHDGIGLEVLRGCTQGCRFCQAGMVTRPVRERSLPRIDALMAEAIAHTGLENVSLVSLSTCDHSRARSLAHQAAARAHPQKVSVSLPSLRLDSFAVELADCVADVRRSGLTFAPEAATPRLRALINKFIPDEDLIRMAVMAYGRGWNHVKTYFMIGLPTETDEDVEAIAALCIKTLEAGRKVNPKAMVRTGVSTFVAKPHTPFQWAPQIGIEETKRKHELLARAFRRHPGIKFGRHAPETSFIEGLLSRAGRDAADLIEGAWRRGARLETWEEHVRLEPWMAAIEAAGFDAPAQFAERDLDVPLPWDHIDVLVSKEWLQNDWRGALALRHAPDCRAGKCKQCGVIEREPDLCGYMLRNQRGGLKDEAARWDGHEGAMETPSPAPAEAVQRLRLRIGRRGEARLLSHLEMQSAWVRALRRAEAPLAYSQGFHAHAKLNFATATPVGEESEGDYMDLWLSTPADAGCLMERLRENLPPGFEVYEARDVALRTASLMSSVQGFRYRIELAVAQPALAKSIEDLLGREEVLVDRKVKAGKQGRGRGAKTRRKIVPVNIRPLLSELKLLETGAAIEFTTRAVDNRVAKPKEVLEALGIAPESARVVKLETRLAEDV